MNLGHRTGALQIAHRRWSALRRGKHGLRSALRAGLTAALLTFSTAAVAERDPHSAAFHYTACRSLLTGDEQSPHLQGSCAGQIALLLQLSDVLPLPMRFCAPSRLTVRQATEAVAAYMERHPAELHLAFPVVAVLALRETWPCMGASEATLLDPLLPPQRLLHHGGGSPNLGR